MSDTVLPRSLDDSITAGEMQKNASLYCWIEGTRLGFKTGSVLVIQWFILFVEAGFDANSDLTGNMEYLSNVTEMYP